MLVQTRKDAAVYYQTLARERARARDFAGARVAYFRCVEAWKQALREDPSLDRFHKGAQQEYAELARTDELYLKLLPEARKWVAQNPGILQTDVYEVLEGFSKDDISYVLYFAEREGEIARVKKGRTYQLFLPTTPEKGMLTS